ncbi:MAG TPA: zinc ribbon domain-containing protein [Gemmatimonadales bacterium]|nr:zinc ribbon domain-containing protein [Gemmatimonadales bacterium]
MLILAGVTLALLAVLLVVEPVLRGISAPARVLLPDSDDEIDPVQRRRDLALAALKEIEFDKATGKLSDDDYDRLKAQYSKEALEVLRELEPAVPTVPPSHRPTDLIEQLIAQARAAASQRGKRPKFCEECGAPVQGKGKFCAECGSALPV